MPFRLFAKKDIALFPPFLTKGDGWVFSVRRFYLQTSEIISSCIGIMIFVNFIFFCGKQDEVDMRFRIINFILSFLITIDFLIKYKFINKLYLNRHYYGIGFMIIDIISGPLSLILNVYFAIVTVEVAITISDIMLLLRIFCLEKIRLLIKDVFYILYVSRYINFALLLTYYVYSYIAYAIFQEISPKFFRNIFKSMLSMFQVLTLDSWNLQVNQSVSKYYGQAWSIFFLFFILFMFFYFINLLLGAFVSYYSNPTLRRNFEYDFQHDDVLNQDLNLEYRHSIEIRDALKLLDMDQTPYQLNRKSWGLNESEVSIYLYISLQILLSMVQLFSNLRQINYALIVIENIFGIYFCILCYQKIMQFRQFINEQKSQFEEKLQDETQIRNEEYSVRLYVVIILLIAGPAATIVDIISLSIYQDIRFGPMLRVLIVLAILYVQKLLFKFVEVLPGVSHIIIFVGGLLFTMALIGHQFIKVDVGYPLFDSLTQSYLFMLQVVTFDSWGDVARIVIRHQAIYVFYFLFLTIFIGFFLMNMLVGVMATMTQPKTQELFEKDHILRQRVNELQVRQLSEHIQQFKGQEQTQHNQLKQILDEFNSSRNTQPLYVIIEGVKYEITSKNFIQFQGD
ncbi:unnamed protein product [Paramecium octaurelia]|uniref:Ion transport domain-containing protein n=1 Tax=Paramecium octaurelia TaxID=43137 RepID=A0A8S1WYS0_PAROT|nr:unnamed protein product [Paramecium octaurelia]